MYVLMCSRQLLALTLMCCTLPWPPAGVSGPCAKCNISPCRGGCKCDASCNCRATWGLSPCDKCNIPQDQGGCKCDSNCNCLAGTCRV
jgi:hypothetical protein